MMTMVVLCTMDDEPRFREVIQRAIDAGTVPLFEDFHLPAEGEHEVIDLHSDDDDEEDADSSSDGDDDGDELGKGAGKSKSKGKRKAGGSAGAGQAKGSASVKPPRKRPSNVFDEAAEAAAMAKKLGLPGDGSGSDDALFALIRERRNKSSEAVLADLEAKYCKPKPKARSSGKAVAGKRK